MRNYKIYTDGSDLKHTSHRMGVGGVLLDESGKLIDKFSEELDHGWLQSNYGTSDCSNPTAEMIAVLVALERWTSRFNTGDHVEINADYMGVKCWNEGEWKINKPYIRKVKEEIQDIIHDTRIQVSWSWVKGHQVGSGIYGSDKYWNDTVDKLAKGL